jgi:hypothetical protein
VRASRYGTAGAFLKVRARSRSAFKAVAWVFGIFGITTALVIVAVVALVVSHYQRDHVIFLSEQQGRKVTDSERFKYGSTGGDRLAGLPIGIFKALPKLCRDYLPGEGWQSLGFIYEDGRDLPVGTSRRYSYGFERVSLNCATCHVGTYRTTPADKPVPVIGMPAHRMNLGRFARFLMRCAMDERFDPWRVVQAAEKAEGKPYSWYDRQLLRFIAVPAIKEFVVLAKHRLRFLEREIEPGPGRFDTFNSAKALLNWNFDKLPDRERVGIVDFPSLWLQEPREQAKMRLHWDGNNDSVDERNRSAAFGSGALPGFADHKSLKLIGAWLRSPQNEPPAYPFPIDAQRTEQGKALYGTYCAHCHGKSGRDFSGERVGHVEAIEEIGTDPCRLDNYTHELALDQGNLYGAYPDKRFKRFRKTYGYANMPLDGLWLRGPYLHNGSVPTVRDLLDPGERRPASFYRGNDVIDRKKLGFISDVPEENGVKYFLYETGCPVGRPTCGPEANSPVPSADHVCRDYPLAGNGNRGHEYGTQLSDEQKNDLVEYLKTF